MSINISPSILGLTGQRVNEISVNKHHKTVHIVCQRDKRRRAIDPLTGKQGTINRYIRRQVKDIPFCGHPCYLEIELAQVFISKNERRLERYEFVDTGICNYAKYKLTSARIEAGNVSIGLIRKRARGIRDTEYFKLKIRQTSVPDDKGMFYFEQ